MIARFRLWLHSWLIAVDQLAHVGLCFWLFVPFGRGKCPNPDETISSRVGRNAEEGKRWALAAEWLIDGLFLILTGQRGHCRASVGS